RKRPRHGEPSPSSPLTSHPSLGSLPVMPGETHVDASLHPSRRRLGLFDVLCIGVNATVGSGVFALPGLMLLAMGGFSPLAYVLCAALLLPVALSFAELAGRFDESGSAYVYARRAFGDGAGFIIGWYCWANSFLAWAANASFFVSIVGERVRG